MDVAETTELARRYLHRQGNQTGGALHVVLADANIEDEFIRSCLRRARRKRDGRTVNLAKALLALSKAERAQVVDGCWYSAHARAASLRIVRP